MGGNDRVLNEGEYEILLLRNQGNSTINISGWRLDGEIGNNRCLIPDGTYLAPNEEFQVATGKSDVTGRGYKCGGSEIWNNEGELIFLHSTDERQISIYD